MMRAATPHDVADEVPPHDAQPRGRRDSQDAVCGCRMANVHAHSLRQRSPPPSEQASGRPIRTRCNMCCGYAMPVGLVVFTTLTFLGSEVYYMIVLAQQPRTAWRVIVCLACLLVAAAMFVPFMWSYYAVVFTSPGFVPAHPWRYRPRVCSDAAPTPPQHTPVEVRGQRSGDEAAAVLVALPDHAADAAAPLRLSPLPLPPPLQPSSSSSLSSSQATAIAGAKAAEAGNTSAGTPTATRIGDEHAAAQPATSHSRSSADRSDAAATPSTPRNPFVVTQLSRRRQPRHCARCALYKPDDAHHCSTCERCVYNFDHHCPWINNCVGRNNYKLFLIFLLYSGVAGLVVGAMNVVVLVLVDTASFEERAGWFVLPALLLVLGACTLLFYVQHRYMLAQGRSTLDTLIADERRIEAAQHWCHSGGGAAAGVGGQGAEMAREQRIAWRARQRAVREARVQRHRLALLGNEHPWWRRYVPVPVRFDDDATIV